MVTMEENSETTGAKEVNSFAKVIELAQEVDKPVAMTGRLSDEYVRKSVQDASRAILEFRNGLLQEMGEETAIDTIEADKLLTVAYRKRLDAKGAVYVVPEAFKLKTPYWVYLKNELAKS